MNVSFSFFIKILLVVTFGFIVPTASIDAQTTTPRRIQFEINAEKQVSPSALEIHFTLQKKGPTLESANQKLLELAKQIQLVLAEHRVSSEDISITSTVMNTSDWLFGKDFVVTSEAKITLKVWDGWASLARKMMALDKDIQFGGVSYAYPNSESIWAPLFSKAVLDLNLRRIEYERALNVKLRLLELHDRRYRPGASSPIYLRKSLQSPAAEASTDQAELMPMSLYQVTLDATFEIL
jgi:hypothetical protein